MSRHEPYGNHNGYNLVYIVKYNAQMGHTALDTYNAKNSVFLNFWQSVCTRKNVLVSQSGTKSISSVSTVKKIENEHSVVLCDAELNFYVNAQILNQSTNK